MKKLPPVWISAGVFNPEYSIEKRKRDRKKRKPKPPSRIKRFKTRSAIQVKRAVFRQKLMERICQNDTESQNYLIKN